MSVHAYQAPAHAWCCTATLDPFSREAKIQAVAGDTDSERSAFQKLRGAIYDITASPDWMESIEISEERGNDEGGAGAYDTMRVDLIFRQLLPTRESWKIWGEEYHFKRLENSFTSLLRASSAEVSSSAIQMAKQGSDIILRALMDEAVSSRFMKRQGLQIPEGENEGKHTWIQLVKMTFLWSLPNFKTGQETEIVVRGHACSNGKPFPVFRSVQPIVVTVAALGHTHAGMPNGEIHPEHEDDATIDKSLPTRFQNPQSKVASWCKQRKKMDNPDTYKPPGVSEVLMVKPFRSRWKQRLLESNDASFSSLELLEGLTSNVFVIYTDGTLRTAQEGVLFGYVRQLVLESAGKCGLKVDTAQPICLQDALDGQWTEVFITSSSRLIWPVSRVLLPSGEEAHNGQKDCEIDGFSEFWADPVLTVPGVPYSTPQWQCILDVILNDAGYWR